MAAGVVLACLLQAPAAEAQRHPYGRDFILVGFEALDVAPVVPDLPVPDPMLAVREPDVESAYTGQMARLEALGGPYASGLEEPLSSLGNYYLERGDLPAALDAYRRALHVVRVNGGLNSPEQVPLLRATLHTYRLSGDMATLDDKYDYYFHLLGAGQPPYTELRLQAALGYLRWQREALRLKIGSNLSRRLLDLVRLNEQLLTAVGEDETLAAAWYSEFALSQLKNLYLLQLLVQPRVQVPSRNSNSPFTPPTRTIDDPVLGTLERYRAGSSGRGVSLLEKALSRLPEDAPAPEFARLQLALADWYQWNEDRVDANRFYATVADTLMAAGRDDLLQAWLGQPVELPDNGAYFQPEPGVAFEPTQLLSLRFDVDERGRARDVATAEEPAEGLEGEASQLRRRMRDTRFRPRWEGGGPVATAAVVRQYAWLD